MAAHEIKVEVTFPLSKKPPFHEEVAAETTVSTVLAEAMDYFEAKPEPNVAWYLSAHNQRQPDTRTVGEIAGEARHVAFRLVKEVTQG